MQYNDREKKTKKREKNIYIIIILKKFETDINAHNLIYILIEIFSY